MALGLRRHARGGELAQLLVDEREEFVRGTAVASRRGIEKANEIGHEGRVYRRVAAGSSENEDESAPSALIGGHARINVGRNTVTSPE